MSFFKARAYLYDENEKSQGYVTFKQKYHGFHIHQSGDMSNGCQSMGPHYNPDDQDHGGRSSKTRHSGDMGNVRSDNGHIETSFYLDNPGFSVDPYHTRTIIGRGVVLHNERDDCGKGKNKESKITGNSGARIMCGPIMKIK